MEHTQQGTNGGLFGALFTTISLLYGMITAQETAYMVTILAGLTTTAYTAWKWHNEYKRRNKNK